MSASKLKPDAVASGIVCDLGKLTLNVLRFALFATFSAIASWAVADAPVANAPLELTAANIEKVIDPPMAEWIDKHKGPGAVVVVVKRDGPVFAKGYGYADIEAKKPFTSDATLVRPGSISKLFTGIAVMQLVEEGKLDLDRDVNVYLDFAVPTPDGGVPVTLRRLLTHRAGFEAQLKGLFSRGGEPEPLGRWLAKTLPVRLFPQGDVPAYSNYGVALAGYIVERVSGEPYAAYIQRHILNPLGMNHSTFQQPLPATLAPLMAKGYRTSDTPPLGFFETISDSPAGALSATGADMGRFIRALMNGGDLDGIRILPKVRLDEMMVPSEATTGDSIGLVFMRGKVGGHDTVGHNGGMIAFFSDLTIFPEQGVGVFVSLDGTGDISEYEELPEPARMIAKRFLPNAREEFDARAALPGDVEVAGVYHMSQRAESSFLRVGDLTSQSVVRIDSAGRAKLFPAMWPFGDGQDIKRLGQNLYEFPGRARFTFEGSDPDSYFDHAVVRMQRVPWSLDARWITPAFIASTAVVLLTLLAWPAGALWRRWRNSPKGQDSGDRRIGLAVRLVLLMDATVIAATAVSYYLINMDYTIANDALNPLVLVFYALAWLGVFGAIPTLWATIQYWRNVTGSRWFRIHHSLIAASCILIAWFFVTFRIAGTTLIY